MILSRATAYDLEFRFPAGDSVIGASLRDYGEFARPEVDLICDLLAEGGDFIDVGANIGAIALPVAKRLPGAQVFAIEASASLAPVLAANAICNDLDNVRTLHAAAGPNQQIARFPDVSIRGRGNHGAIGFGTESGGARRPVLMLPLDSFAMADLRVVKIDVEGFELEVLQGARNMLASTKPAILFEANVNTPSVKVAVAQLMMDAGYDLYWFYAPFVTCDAYGDQRDEAGAGDANILAMPSGWKSPWDLPRLSSPTDERPKTAAAYGYLKRYGY